MLKNKCFFRRWILVFIQMNLRKVMFLSKYKGNVVGCVCDQINFRSDMNLWT